MKRIELEMWIIYSINQSQPNKTEDGPWPGFVLPTSFIQCIQMHHAPWVRGKVIVISPSPLLSSNVGTTMSQFVETYCCHCAYAQISVTDVSLSEQPSAASITADTAAASTSTASALHLHSNRFKDGNLTLRSVLLHCISIRFHTQLFLYFIVLNVMFCTSSTFVVYIQFFVCWFA